jgi:hypothetical protein
VFHDLFQKGKGDSIIFRNLPAKGHLFLYSGCPQSRGEQPANSLLPDSCPALNDERLRGSVG